MINHVRTILLNVEREIDPNFPGEEYIPSTFKPIELPTKFKKLHNIIFGGAPDRYMLNYRAQQLMAVLHSTELRENVLDFDKRITYWPQRNNKFYSFPFGSTAEKIGSFTGQIIFAGAVEPDDAAGQLHNMWKITIKDSDTVIVRDLIPPVREQEYTYTLTDGVSDAIPLIGTTQEFKFEAPVGAGWFVESIVRPKRDMGTVLADLKTGVGILDELNLWGAAPTEPLLTYKNLWKHHEQYAYQLGGLVLALTTKINELHTKAVVETYA